MVNGTARPIEELHSVDDCTEEVIFLFMDAFVAVKAQDVREIMKKRDGLYEQVRKVIVRAQGVRPPEDDRDSRSLT